MLQKMLVTKENKNNSVDNVLSPALAKVSSDSSISVMTLNSYLPITVIMTKFLSKVIKKEKFGFMMLIYFFSIIPQLLCI